MWDDLALQRDLEDGWAAGDPTATIGRALSARYDLPISKNAVIGKAHRLGLTPRPSPLRRVVLA